MSLSYEFPEQGSADDEGFNDPVRTHFDMNIASSIARESIQNIIDARVKGGKAPAVAEFSMTNISPDDIPDKAGLTKIFKACQEYWKNSRECSEFTESAIRHLSSSRRIPVLRISDYNTVGLTGSDDDRNGNYHNFMKAAGATNKIGDTGGSFGLGKGAYFAASAFRMILVASKFSEGRGVGYLFQGKCRLMSHRLGGTTRRAVGSYGLPNQLPVRDVKLIPPKFIREDVGTDIYIIGFRNHETWVDDIFKSVLNHFWRAIQKGELEVVVNGEKITGDNLKTQMRRHFSEDEEDTPDNPNPLPYFNAYTSSQRKAFKEELPTLGKVECYLLPNDKYPNRVACFRKTGMLVQPRSFRSALVNYAGVFLCESDKGNEILKRMEPPSHDRWDKHSSNAKTPEGKPLREVSAADRELVEFIRKCVRSLAEDNERTRLSVGGLEKYLSLPSDEEEIMEAAGLPQEGTKVSANESGTEIPKIDEAYPVVPPPRRLRVMTVQSRGTNSPGDAILPGGEGVHEGGGGGGGNDGIGGSEGAAGSDENGDTKIRLLSSASYRSFVVRRNGEVRHIVIVRGGRGKVCHLRVMAGTDSAYEQLAIDRAQDEMSGSALAVAGNYVKNVPLDRKGEAKVGMTFAGPDMYSLSVGIYENI